MSPPACSLAATNGRTQREEEGVTFLSALSPLWLRAWLTGLLFRSTSWFWITVSWGCGFPHSWPGISRQWGNDWKLLSLSHIPKYASTDWTKWAKHFLTQCLHEVSSPFRVLCVVKQEQCLLGSWLYQARVMMHFDFLFGYLWIKIQEQP